MTAASNSDARKRQTPDRPAASDGGPTSHGICTTDPHHFVWTWPVEGGSGSVGVCDLCGAVTTGERDAKIREAAEQRAAEVVAKVRALADEWEREAREAGTGALFAEPVVAALRAALPSTPDAAPVPQRDAGPCFPRPEDGHNCTLTEGHDGPHVCCDGHEWTPADPAPEATDAARVGERERIAQAIEARRVHVHDAPLGHCEDGCGWLDLAAMIARSEADTTGGES